MTDPRLLLDEISRAEDDLADAYADWIREGES